MVTGGRRSVTVTVTVTQQQDRGRGVHASLGRRWWLLPLLVFAVSRVVQALLLEALGRDQVMFVDGPGSRVVGEMPASPGYALLTTNWDGQWYHSIASSGYPTTLPRLPDGSLAQSEWAFFPMFPALCRLVMGLSHLPFAWAAMVVSLSAGALAMCLLHALLVPTVGRFGATTTVLGVCTYPSSLVLQGAYSESLALLVITGCLLLLSRRRYGALCCAVLVLALTRPVVVVVAPVVALHWWMRWRRRTTDPFPVGEQLRAGLAVVAAVLGFGLWPAVVGVVAGDPLAYLEIQRQWYPLGMPTWLGALAGRGTALAMVVGLLAVLGVALVVRRTAARGWLPELRWWNLSYVVFLIVSTRPTSSTVRLAMLALVPWWVGPVPPGRDLTRRAQVLTVVVVAVVGTTLSYAWIDMLYVAHPGSVGNP
jgi:hypothetical protein